MKAKSAAIFLATSATTAIGWVAFWPGTPPKPPDATISEPVEKPWQREELNALITAIENGESEEEKLQAALRIERIPAPEILPTLSSIQTTRDGELTLSAKTLLINWASHDPEAAITWAWQEFRSKPAWSTAFREIGPAWAWRNPEGLKAWTFARWEAHPPTKERPFGDITLAEANTIDAPVLQFGDLDRISGWLLKEDPKLGMEVFLKRGGFSSHDDRWEDVLTEPRMIERALQAFSPEMIEVLKTRDVTKPFTLGPESHAQTLLILWKKLDPESFLSSAYTDCLSEHSSDTITVTAKEWSRVDPQQREKTANDKLAALPEKQTPSSAAIIAKEWGSTDPAACREWIESLTGKNQYWAAGEYVRNHAASSLMETLDWIQQFEPEQRGSYFIQAFDAWLKANPDRSPEVSSWSESRRRAWSDLAAITSLGRP